MHVAGEPEKNPSKASTQQNRKVLIWPPQLDREQSSQTYFASHVGQTGALASEAGQWVRDVAWFQQQRKHSTVSMLGPPSTPVWAYGIAPGIPPKSILCIIVYDVLEESKWHIAGEHERDPSTASTQQKRKVLIWPPKLDHDQGGNNYFVSHVGQTDALASEAGLGVKGFAWFH